VKKYTWIVLSTPYPGVEDDYNDWYSTQHVPDVVSSPGFVSGKRMRAVLNYMPGEPQWRYAAIYEAETDDPAAMLAEFKRRVQSGEVETRPYVDPSSFFAVLFEEIG
jgi:hypothetical protein